MRWTLLVKRAYANLLYHLGIVQRKILRNAGKKSAVLMYHRVLPASEASGRVQPGMYVTPESLRTHIAFLREHFEIVPLSVLADLRNGFHAPKPFCALTFDDGWWDFYVYAYPILVQENVPATVFLPTNYIGTTEWFWTDELYELLGHMEANRELKVTQDLPQVEPQVREIIRTSRHGVGARETIIQDLKKLPANRIRAILDQLTVTVGFCRPERNRAFLTWQEVQEMFSSGCINFGSHTATHALLTTIQEQAAREEMASSKSTLLTSGVVDPARIEFSYPNGNYSPTIANLAREAGYHSAVVTERGWHAFDSDQFTIKRIAMHQDVSDSKAMFGARLAGLL